MDVSYIFQNLNEPQRQAVTSESQNLLVLAGAGSGKTRVLAHRVAWLIKGMGVSPHSLLTVTFTNKAASEMRGRIENIVEEDMGNFSSPDRKNYETITSLDEIEDLLTITKNKK